MPSEVCKIKKTSRIQLLSRYAALVEGCGLKVFISSLGFCLSFWKNECKSDCYPARPDVDWSLKYTDSAEFSV